MTNLPSPSQRAIMAQCRSRTSISSVFARAIPALGSLLFASILASLPINAFMDRENYLAYLDNSLSILHSWLSADILSTLTNEPLWILLNAALAAFLQNEQALRILIFVPAAAVAYQVLRTHPRNAVVLVCFLLIPQILKNHVVHLRQGAAIAVFLTGWFAAKPGVRWICFLSAPFIHSSFFFVIFLLGLARLFKRLQVSPIITMCFFAVAGIAVGLTLGVLVTALGARQGNEVEFVAAQGISGFGFLYWLIVLILLLTASRKFIKSHLLETGSIVFYLSTYFLSPFTARVFESTLLLIFLAALRMKGGRRRAFLSLIFLYALLQWLMTYYGANSMVTPSGV